VESEPAADFCSLCPAKQYDIARRHSASNIKLPDSTALQSTLKPSAWRRKSRVGFRSSTVSRRVCQFFRIGIDSFYLVNGTPTQKKSKSHTANGAELGTSDHEDSDEDKEDEVAAGVNGASGG
jgi:hypothetical protein